MVAPKLRGVLTDHASDQKRLFQLLNQWKQNIDCKSRAGRKLKTLTVDQQLYALTSYLDNTATTVSNWRSLLSDQQAAIMHDAWLALTAQIGEAEFQKLRIDEQLEVDFIAWAGCCMHKELNAVKGGASRMAAEWEELGSKPLIVLLNKYESIRNARGMNEQLMRGGIKLAYLAGAIFNNKDNKKGYQSSVDNFFEQHFGYSTRFTDISNTRYGSYCNAAMMLIVHLEKYKQLVCIVCLAKSTPGFNNIESNVLNGLEDIPTLTELVVLVLYAQAIGAKTSAATGALDGQSWDRPDVIYNILSLVPILPDIQPILVAFFWGALQTWERFTSEFETSGQVTQATKRQRESAWMPATNDISEGALGQCRQMLRRAPTMSDHQRNARVMWSHNDTHSWAKQTLTSEDKTYIRQEARCIDASGDNKKQRANMNAALEERAAAGKVKQEKSMARQEEMKLKLAGVQLRLYATYDELFKMKVSDLDLQIDKLQEMGDKEGAKVKEILAGLERRRAPDIPVTEDVQMESEHTESVLPDDIELYHPDKVVF
ncbi:hypothetical protein B0J17DRAFT_738164 [Rhizoctonia solani]|nr:hypothetical protein B0J17DRAFT_738164 [Rhizoctonia solani]